jgi:hypothetical protein
VSPRRTALVGAVALLVSGSGGASGRSPVPDRPGGVRRASRSAGAAARSLGLAPAPATARGAADAGRDGCRRPRGWRDAQQAPGTVRVRCSAATSRAKVPGPHDPRLLELYADERRGARRGAERARGLGSTTAWRSSAQGAARRPPRRVRHRSGGRPGIPIDGAPRALGRRGRRSPLLVDGRPVPDAAVRARPGHCRSPRRRLCDGRRSTGLLSRDRRRKSADGVGRGGHVSRPPTRGTEHDSTRARALASADGARPRADVWSPWSPQCRGRDGAGCHRQSGARRLIAVATKLGIGLRSPRPPRVRRRWATGCTANSVRLSGAGHPRGGTSELPRRQPSPAGGPRAGSWRDPGHALLASPRCRARRHAVGLASI